MHGDMGARIISTCIRGAGTLAECHPVPHCMDARLPSVPLQVVIRRGEPIAGPEGPILICTRNDDLTAIVEATPPERRKGESCRQILRMHKSLSCCP